MKNLWGIVSFMAVVNLLALIIFGAWLWRTERLDVMRMRAIRDILAPTLEESEAVAAEQAAEEAMVDAAVAEAARRASPPLPSGAHVAYRTMEAERERQASRQLEAMTAQHRAELERRTSELDEREAAIIARQERWRDTATDETRARAEQQFQKTVRLYESLAGKQAKKLLLELVERGEMDRAVSYLDAMNPRSAAKTLKELKSEEESKLATELLEGLRTYRLEAEESEAASHAQRPAPAS